MSKLIPSVEYLERVVGASDKFLRRAMESGSVVGSDVPSGFPNRDVFMRVAIDELENALNPRRLPFKNSARHNIGASGWRDPLKIVHAWQWLRQKVDEILVAWEMPISGWPPKIALDTWKAIHAATGQLREEVKNQLLALAKDEPTNEIGRAHV